MRFFKISLYFLPLEGLSRFSKHQSKNRIFMFKRVLFTVTHFFILQTCLQAQAQKRLKFISSPEIKISTDSSVVVVWQTNQPTTAQIVIYTHSERKVIDIDEMSENHEFTINQLHADTIYQYRLIASNGNVGIVTPLKTAHTVSKIAKQTE